jgi:hypothetical protein
MITIPDVVIDLSTQFFHLVFEFIYEMADVMFEAIETMLENVVEYLFNTEQHDTQIIVYYIIVSLLAYPLFRLGRLILRLLLLLIEVLPVQYAHYKNQWLLLRQDAIYYWQQLPFIIKLKWILIACSTLYLASFLVM